MQVALPPEIEIRRSAKVATVAGILDCDVKFVRGLINKGELEAHGKGKRGVRVFLDSVAEYQKRQTLSSRDKRVPTVKQRRDKVSSASHRNAVARLKAAGLL